MESGLNDDLIFQFLTLFSLHDMTLFALPNIASLIFKAEGSEIGSMVDRGVLTKDCLKHVKETARLF